MWAWPFLILFFLFSFSGEAPAASEEEELLAKTHLRRSEYQLAKAPQIYFIFELAEKKIWIKIKGVVLKELPLESCSQWGMPIQPKPFTLLSKSAIMKPERAEVKPAQKNGEDPPEPPALQLENMPARYRLNFGEGIRVYIRPTSEGILPAFLNLFSSLKSYLITWPFGTLWSGLHGESFTEVVVYLKEKDARALYWAFQEGFPCIFWNP